MRIERSNGKAIWWQWLIIPPIILLLLPVALGLLLLFVIFSVALHICIWLLWCTQGRDILFVYSNSPVWHDYLEQRLLPLLEDRAVVLNWSDRSRWRFPPTLARIAFQYFGGQREFNPLAVVFRPLRRARVFRFWQPFRDFKHGDPEPLRRLEKELFELIGVRREHSL
jgi:hypothetical protein